MQVLPTALAAVSLGYVMAVGRFGAGPVLGWTAGLGLAAGLWLWGRQRVRHSQWYRQRSQRRQARRRDHKAHKFQQTHLHHQQQQQPGASSSPTPPP